MRYEVGPVAFLLLLGFVAGLAVAWLTYRRRMLTNEHERRFAALHDDLLQDVQGLALSLQAVADQLPPDEPAKRQLEQILDRTDQLLTDRKRRATGGSA